MKKIMSSFKRLFVWFWGLKFQIIIILLLGIAVIVIIRWSLNPIHAPNWTGFGPYDEKTEGPRAKTLWDWLDLLIIPVFLAGGAWWLNKIDKEHESIRLKNETKLEKELASDKLRQNAIESYFDRMSKIILEYDLEDANEESKIGSLGRAYTLSVLRVLDGERKGQVLLFLSDANLLSTFDLKWADLRGAFLRGADLTGIRLKGSDLSNSQLSFAKLNNADLTAVDLRNADLNWVSLKDTILTSANLLGAKVDIKTLVESKSLSNAIMPDGKIYEDWIGEQH